MPKILIISLEWVLFGSLWGIVVSGNCDSIASNIPFSFELIGLPVVVAMCFSVVSRFRNPLHSISLTSAFGFSSLAFAATHFSMANSSSVTAIPALYFFVIIGSGLLGRKFTWLLPFLSLILGEAIFILFKNAGNPEIRSLITNHFSSSLIPYLYLLFSGLLPSIVASGPLQVNSGKSTPDENLQESHKNNTKLETVSTRTQVFTLDCVSEIKHNRENDVQDLLYSVVYFMSRNFKAYSSLGFIFDPVAQTFNLNSFQSRSTRVRKGVSIPLGKGVVGRIGTEKHSFMSGNLSNYNSETLYYNGSEEVNSIIAVPIVSENQELVGALVIDSQDKQSFKDQDKEILNRFSSLAAALISNARMRMYQERIAQTFKIFYQASHQFTTALKVSDVFEVLFQLIPNITSCTRQIAVTFDEEKKSAVILRINGHSPDVEEGFEFKLNTGLFSYVLQKRKLINLADYKQYETKYYRFVPDEIRNQDVRSLIIFPITDDECRCRGLISVESDIPNQFAGETEQILATIVENASVAFTRALLYQQMERLATTDGLTELNNHRNFQELLSRELERSRRYKHPLSLLLMDIDHFKTFNDTYGHPVGDLVLKEISACIRKSLRINDIPARYGGEEFTVICPETNEEGAMIIADRIRALIENHVIHSLEKELRVTVSIGCATYPTLASSQQTLIDNADKSLYYSKEHGRNQVTLFKPQMTGKEK